MTLTVTVVYRVTPPSPPSVFLSRVVMYVMHPPSFDTGWHYGLAYPSPSVCVCVCDVRERWEG